MPSSFKMLLFFPGTECYTKVISEFNGGGDLKDADGKIDRTVLGKKVFGNAENLDKLQKIVWPEVWKLAEAEAIRLWKSEKEVVIFDAALLIKAGWAKEMHQVRKLSIYQKNPKI